MIGLLLKKVCFIEWNKENKQKFHNLISNRLMIVIIGKNIYFRSS